MDDQATNELDVVGASGADVRCYYAALDVNLGRGRREAPARCFVAPEAHRGGDRHPSMSISLATGAFFCHGCGAHGGAYDAARAMGESPRDAIDLMIAHGLTERRPAAPRRRRRARTTQPKRPGTQGALQRRLANVALAVDDSELHAWAAALQNDRRLLDQLRRARGWTARGLAGLGIGIDRDRRIVIPVRDADQRLISVLRYQPDPARRGATKISADRGSRRALYPAPETLHGEPLLVVEGEPDAIAAHCARLAAVATPGASGWRAAWARRFSGRRVIVLADADVDGRAAARRILADLDSAGVRARARDLHPDREDGWDLTDYLRGREWSSTIAELAAAGDPLGTER